MSLPPPSDEFMDDLFGAMQSDAPIDEDTEREDVAVAKILGRLGVDGHASVLVAPTNIPRVRPMSRALIYSALAATLLLGILLGLGLHPDQTPIATFGVAPAPLGPLMLSAPHAEVSLLPAALAPEVKAPTLQAIAAAPVPDDVLQPLLVPQAPQPPPAAPLARVLLTAADGAAGLELSEATRLYVIGTGGELDAGPLSFTRRGDIVPPIDRVRFPALGLYALPVGTVFHAVALENLALVTVTEGEVHLVQDDGARLGSVRAGESAAVGPSAGGLRMVSTGGVNASGLGVLLPEATASESDLQAALVAQRLRSLSSDVIRDLRGLETLDE